MDAPVPGEPATGEVAELGEAGEPVPFVASEHIGMIIGALLGLLVLTALVALAVIGFEPATGLLILIVVGLALIALGSRMR